MLNTKGDVTVMNISREKNICMILCSIQNKLNSSPALCFRMFFKKYFFLKILLFAFPQPQYVLIMFFLKISYIFSLMFLCKGSYKKECIKVEPFANCHQLLTVNIFAVPVPFQLHPLPPPPPPTHTPTHITTTTTRLFVTKNAQSG